MTRRTKDCGVAKMQREKLKESPNLYEAIFRRKSVRRFDLTPLAEYALGDHGTYEHLKTPLQRH